MAKLRIPASGPFIEGANPGDVLIWDGTEWNPGPVAPAANSCVDFEINSLADFPEPVGGVITLESGAYCIGGAVDLEGNRLVLPAGAEATFSGGSITSDVAGAAVLELQPLSVFSASGLSLENTSGAASGESALHCDVSDGQYIYLDRCFIVQNSTVGQSVLHTGGRLVLSRTRIKSTNNGIDCGAGADGKTLLYGSRISNCGNAAINVSAAHAGIIWVGGTMSNFTKGILINADLDGLNVVAVEGNNFADWLEWVAGAVLTVQIANVRLFSFNQGIIWPAANFPTRVMSVLASHFEQTPFVGFTAASARAVVRSCSSNTGLITETAIVP